MSAFSLYEDVPIAKLLAQCELVCQGSNPGLRYRCNILRRNTVGLKFKHDAMMDELMPVHNSPIQCKPKPVRSQNVGSVHTGAYDGITSPVGKFDAVSILGDGRYGLVKPNRVFGSGITSSPLGTGQFASVFNAVDLYRCGPENPCAPRTFAAPPTLAMKVIDKKFKILALREISLLNYIGNKLSNSYFCRMVDAFCHCPGAESDACSVTTQGDYCIVMQKYDFTLYSFIPRGLEEGRCRDGGLGLGGSRLGLPLLSPHASAGLSTGGMYRPCSVEGTFGPASMDTGEREREYRCQRFMQNIRFIAQSLLSGCFLMHGAEIIHGDIKPENIFICSEDHDRLLGGGVGGALGGSLLAELVPGTDYGVCLGDFGTALTESEIFSLYCRDGGAGASGSSTYRVKNIGIQPLSYRAPEVLLCEYEYPCRRPGADSVPVQPQQLPFGTGIDIWSVGIVLLELCLGHSLFNSSSHTEQIQALRDSLFVFPDSFYSNIPACSSPPSMSRLDGSGVPESKRSSALSTATTTATAASTAAVGFSMSEYMVTIKRLLLASSIYRDVEVMCSPMFIHFLAHCLHPLPEHRLSALGALQHPYIDGVVPAKSVGVSKRVCAAEAAVAASAARLRRSHLSSSPGWSGGPSDVATGHNSGVNVLSSSCTGAVLDNTLNSISALMNNLHSARAKPALPVPPLPQTGHSKVTIAVNAKMPLSAASATGLSDTRMPKVRDHGSIPVFETLAAGSSGSGSVGGVSGHKRAASMDEDRSTLEEFVARSRRRRVVDYTDSYHSDSGGGDSDGNGSEREGIGGVRSRPEEALVVPMEASPKPRRTRAGNEAAENTAVAPNGHQPAGSHGRMMKHTNVFEVL